MSLKCKKYLVTIGKTLFFKRWKMIIESNNHKIAIDIGNPSGKCDPYTTFDISTEELRNIRDLITNILVADERADKVDLGGVELK